MTKLSSNIIFLIAIYNAAFVKSHSWMSDPPAYNQVYKANSCVGAECYQACPSIWNSGMKNSRAKPAKRWQRGQRVVIRWVRNNHRGGMFRVSIVPVEKMMSKEWHAKFALSYGCWDTGVHRCSGEACGTDSDHEAFSRSITVPAVFPDGDYVVGHVWYGGLDYTKQKGDFPDYYSCSFVRIEGGDTEVEEFQPYFEGWVTSDKSGTELCRTAADTTRQCQRQECNTRSFYAVARPFKNGAKPDPIRKREIMEYTGNRSGGKKKNGRPRSSKKPERDSGFFGKRGNPLCSGKVCCPQSCGKCGGRGCNKRGRAGDICCASKVKATGRVCGQEAPPCVIR